MIRHPKILSVLAAVLVIAVPATAAEKASTPTTAPGIRVAGNRLIDNAGVPLRVAGVTVSGAEYACAQGWGSSTAPSTTPRFSDGLVGSERGSRPTQRGLLAGHQRRQVPIRGPNYQAAIRSYVNLLHAHGPDVILDLHWSAPGSQLALSQEDAPDADHAPAFWSSVAAQYKGVAGIAYDLFNEPHDISWSCWLSGCTTQDGYQAVGQQQLIDAVRSAGATQPVIVEGLQWGGDLFGVAVQPAARSGGPARSGLARLTSRSATRPIAERHDRAARAAASGAGHRGRRERLRRQLLGTLFRGGQSPDRLPGGGPGTRRIAPRDHR